jgi:hypothetical protein
MYYTCEIEFKLKGYSNAYGLCILQPTMLADPNFNQRKYPSRQEKFKCDGYLYALNL